MALFVFFYGKNVETKIFKKLIFRSEIFNKNDISRFQYTFIEKMKYHVQFKKKVVREKNKHTFLKKRFFSFLGSQNVLICKKNQNFTITMVLLYEEPKF